MAAVADILRRSLRPVLFSIFCKVIQSLSFWIIIFFKNYSTIFHFTLLFSIFSYPYRNISIFSYPLTHRCTIKVAEWSWPYRFSLINIKLVIFHFFFNCLPLRFKMYFQYITYFLFPFASFCSSFFCFSCFSCFYFFGFYSSSFSVSCFYLSSSYFSFSFFETFCFGL